MSYINRYCKKLKKLSFEEKEIKAKEIFNNLLEILPNNSEEDRKESTWLIFGTALSVVFSDNVLDPSEVNLINYILSEKYDESSIKKIVKKYESQIDFVISIFKFLKKGFKKMIINFCILFALADGEFSEEEQRVIVNLSK